jgi:hypothetical protein
MEIIVDPRGDTPTITRALALVGDREAARILIRPGIYRELVKIRGNVELRAEGGPSETSIQTLDHSAVHVDGGNAVLLGSDCPRRCSSRETLRGDRCNVWKADVGRLLCVVG